MSENLIISIITVFGSCITSFSLVNWRLAALEKKVDQHNQYSDKISSIQQDIALMKQDMSYIKEKLG